MAFDEDLVFRALSSEVRRQILMHLQGGEMPAGEIAARFELAAPTVSRHLGVLKVADLVEERRDGNRILYRARHTTLRSSLERLLAATAPGSGQREPAGRGSR